MTMEKDRAYQQYNNTLPRPDATNNMHWFSRVHQQAAIGGANISGPETSNSTHMSGVTYPYLQSSYNLNPRFDFNPVNYSLEQANMYKPSYGTYEPFMHQERYQSHPRTSYIQSVGDQSSIDLGNASNSFAMSRELQQNYSNSIQEPVTGSLYTEKGEKGDNSFSYSVKEMRVNTPTTVHHTTVEQSFIPTNEHQLIASERNRRETDPSEINRTYEQSRQYGLLLGEQASQGGLPIDEEANQLLASSFKDRPPCQGGLSLNEEASHHDLPLGKDVCQGGLSLNKQTSQGRSNLDKPSQGGVHLDKEASQSDLSLDKQANQHSLHVDKQESKYGIPLDKQTNHHTLSADKQASQHDITLDKQASQHGMHIDKQASPHGLPSDKQTSQHDMHIDKQASPHGLPSDKQTRQHDMHIDKQASQHGLSSDKQAIQEDVPIDIQERQADQPKDKQESLGGMSSDKHENTAFQSIDKHHRQSSVSLNKQPSLDRQEAPLIEPLPKKPLSQSEPPPQNNDNEKTNNPLKRKLEDTNVNVKLKAESENKSVEKLSSENEQNKETKSLKVISHKVLLVKLPEASKKRESPRIKANKHDLNSGKPKSNHDEDSSKQMTPNETLSANTTVIRVYPNDKGGPETIHVKVAEDKDKGLPQKEDEKVKVKSLLNSLVHYVKKPKVNTDSLGREVPERKKYPTTYKKKYIFIPISKNKDESISSDLNKGDKHIDSGKKVSKNQKNSQKEKPVLNCVVCGKNHNELIQSEYEAVCHVTDSDTCANSVISSLSTLPMLFYIGMSGNSEHGLGVFCKTEIQVGTKFGPVVGEEMEFKKISPGMDFRHVWYVSKDTDWKDLMFLSTENELKSNWCRYLRPSLEKNECNLVCIWKGQALYFISRKSVKAGDELIFYFNCFEKHRCSRSSSPALLQMDLSDEGDHKYSCTLCKVTFSEGVSYVKHCQIYHTFKTKQIRSQCRLCSETFLSKKRLLEHVNLYHGGSGGEFVCAFCGKQFVYKTRLKDHMRNVHLEDPLKCDECGNTYLNGLRLRQHKLRAHSKEIWECDKCNKHFANKHVLAKHKKIHEESYSQACDRCGKLFRDKNNLKVHLLTHSGVKPFRCEEEGCSAAFTIKQCLQSHYRKAHAYSDSNMPEITRSVPFTTEGYMGQDDDFQLDLSAQINDIINSDQ